MSVALLVKNEIRQSAKVLLGMSLLLALSLSLTVTTGITERMLKESSAVAADRFDLLAGVKGSQVSLLLGSVFLKDEPLSLVPVSLLKNLDNDKGVKWAAPIALGDHVGDSVLVGTTLDLATFGGIQRPDTGRLFEKPFEAVVGSGTPFLVGDKITPTHGRVKGMGHQHHHAELTVVGKMPPTGTPWDRAVLIPIKTVWDMHKHSGHTTQTASLEAWRQGDLSGYPGVSAVVIKPKTFSDAYRLRQNLNQTSLEDTKGNTVNLMGVFSGEVLVTLYGILGTATKALGIFSWLTLIIALGSTVLTGVLLGALRRPTLLQLRAIGAPSSYIRKLMWSVVMFVVVVGSVGGFLIGYVFSFCTAGILVVETGISMTPVPGMREIILTTGTCLVGALCALLPAWLAGRTQLH